MATNSLLADISSPGIDERVASTCIANALIIRCHCSKGGSWVASEEAFLLLETLEVPDSHVLDASSPESVISIFLREGNIEDRIRTSFFGVDKLAAIDIEDEDIVVV